MSDAIATSALCARTLAVVAAASLAVACERGGTSTREVRAAAIQHAKEKLRLPASAPLEATAWVGQTDEREGLVICGTVSGKGSGSGVRPQRFAATADPIRWLIFEDAHDPLVASQPDKFPEWQRLCPQEGKSPR